MHTSSRSVPPKIASVPPVVSNASHPVPIQVLEDRDDWARCVCFYADESKVVSGSSDHTLRIWDRKTGAAQVLSGHTGWVWDVDVSRDGKMIVSGSSDKTVRIWNGESGETMHVFEGYGESVNSVEFSRDSSRVVSGCDDHTVRVWSVGTGELIFEPIECHGRVLCVRYSPSGDRIASGGNSVKIWNAGTGNRILSIRNSPVASLAWTADAAHLIGGGWGEVVIWNSDNGEQLRMWRAHGGLIRGLSLSPTAATHLATSNWWHKTAFIFDISTGEQVAALEHDGNVQGIAFSPSGRLLATGCEDNKLYLWEAPTSEHPQTKSPAQPFSSLFDRPATPQAGSSRNDRPGLDPFSDRLPNRAQQAAPQHQRVFNRARNAFANVFTRRRAVAAKTSLVRETVRCRRPDDPDDDLPDVTGTNSSETAADNALTSNRLEPAGDSVIRTQPQCTEMAAVLGHTSSAEQSGMTPDLLPTAGNAVTSNQRESIEMVAISRSSIPLVILPNTTVLAHASSQPTPLMDLLPLSVTSRQASSTSASEPLSGSSNSTCPPTAWSWSHDVDVPIAITVSREELAIIQEVRRRGAIAAFVTTADPSATKTTITSP
ncbi:WD40 repeat-like protein [Paxillus ammoniavirescens]|nr:WD40 repeat-like protein [Paxillus ammoniavirescens]